MRISDWSSDVCSSDLDSRDNLFSGITARAMIQQPAKSALVRWVFIDVRDAQFWLPKKRMIRTFEYLPLLGDRMNDRFQRRSAISDAEPPGFDFGDHLGETTPNRTEILDRSEKHTSDLQSHMRNSYAVFCLKKKKQPNKQTKSHT